MDKLLNNVKNPKLVDKIVTSDITTNRIKEGKFTSKEYIQQIIKTADIVSRRCENG